MFRASCPTRNRYIATVLLVSTMLPALAAAADEDSANEAVIEEVVVFGRNTNLLGSAQSASEGSVGGADLLIRPLVRTAELLESMPGMVAVQHSGSGKANQYFLRGFNLDHGTDYSVRLDGMPMNMRSHGHGQGYLDVNGVIPETVERIDYRKGPYLAEQGDFSMAGVSLIRTIDGLDQPFISAAVGENGWQRYVGGLSETLGEGTLTLIGEYKTYDGPWSHEEDLDHVSLWGKYTTDMDLGQLTVTLSGYDAQWEPTEQIPERAIGSAVCRNEFCTLDPSADGETLRWMANAQLEGEQFAVSLWTQYYDWSLSSNPTYDFQLNQLDQRWTSGGRGVVILVNQPALQLDIGGDFRFDDIREVGLEAYQGGQFQATLSDNEVQQGSIGAYIDGTWYATERLRLMGGLRFDYFEYDVEARSTGSFDGEESDTRVSPKASIAYAANDNVEVYAGWGRGFHSNDARGVVNATDPVPGLSPGTGYELGTRLALGDFKLTAAYWWLDQDSELIFVGDANSVEPKGSSERRGFEWTLFWQPQEWLALDAAWTNSRARYTDNPEGNRVEGAVEKSGQLGLTLTRSTWDASIRLRYLGPYALLADNSQRADAMTTVNLRFARHWQDLTLFAEVINLFDDDGKEIVYHYPAYVAGLDAPGLSSETIDCETVNCRMSRVAEPRAVRGGLRYRF